MTTAVPALSMAVALVALAAWVVRPVPVEPRRRPRHLAPAGNSAVRWLPCPARFAEAVHDAGLDGSASRWWTAVLSGLATIGALGALVGGPVLGVLASVAAAAGVVGGLHLASGRRQQLLVRGISDSLDAIGRSARAGSSVVQALAALDRPDASPADRLFVDIARRVERGQSLERSLERVVADHSAHAVRLAVAAIAVGYETGAPPARAVEGVAATLRDRAALDREAKAHASQARASAVVLVVAPVAFSLFAVATDPRVGDFLFRSAVGWVCLTIGVVLDVVGALWMRSIMGTAR